MKKKIVIALLALFALFTFGAAIATMNIITTSSIFNRVLKLHQIEDLRHKLIICLQKVQADLYTVNTPLSRELNSIIEDVTDLEKSASACIGCHHEPAIQANIDDVLRNVESYKRALSQYITASANSERIERLQLDAAAIGNHLLMKAEDMSFAASKTLGNVTRSAIYRINDTKTVLVLTLLVSAIISAIVAIKLTRAVTRPVNELVNATRRISSGELGYEIARQDDTEFGELATTFNTMSRDLRDGYTALQNEITGHKQTEKYLAESEKFLSTIFDSIRDPFSIISRDFGIVRVNEAYAELKNKTVSQLIGQRCYETLKDRKSVCPDCIVLRTFKSEDPCSKEKSILLADGSQLWIEIYTYPIFREDGTVTHVIEYTRDTTERKRAEEALKVSRERYALAARGANDGLWDFDLASQKIYFSPRWKLMLGFEETAITDSPDEWFNRVHPDDIRQLEADFSSHFEGLTVNFRNEHRLLHRDGTYRWMLTRGVAVRDDQGKVYRIAGSQTDITERKAAEAQLLHDAFHDALTGLPNRALFIDRLSQAIKSKSRNINRLFAVLFLDIDRFKIINDSLGHLFGDHLLIAVGQRLEKCVRPGDTISRLGGDEFAILLDDIRTPSEAVQITDRIHASFKEPFNLTSKEVFTTASIGIVISTTGLENPEDFLRNADIAMYHAKANGRARHEIFDTKMHISAVARLELETDLRRALDNNELELHYQPIVSTTSGRISGLEALLRWRHAEHGIIYPAKFIEMAEETGLIIPIGRWVIHEACRQMSVWHSKFPEITDLKISINLSSKQFTPLLIEQIQGALLETGLDPGSLQFEITESLIIHNAEAATSLLMQLKALGVTIHMDDFGTGYSSLSYLHQFPIDALKIDRSFTRTMSLDQESLEIIKTIISLASNLKIDVIAEGVELADQMKLLTMLKCNYMQGYLFSRPLPASDAEALLATKSDLIGNYFFFTRDDYAL